MVYAQFHLLQSICLPQGSNLDVSFNYFSLSSDALHTKSKHFQQENDSRKLPSITDFYKTEQFLRKAQTLYHFTASRNTDYNKVTEWHAKVKPKPQAQVPSFIPYDRVFRPDRLKNQLNWHQTWLHSKVQGTTVVITCTSHTSAPLLLKSGAGHGQAFSFFLSHNENLPNFVPESMVVVVTLLMARSFRYSPLVLIAIEVNLSDLWTAFSALITVE